MQFEGDLMFPLVAPVLEAFLKLLEKILDFEKAKFQDKQTLFKEVIKPLFEELEPVVLNYIKMFKDARRTVESNSSEQKLRKAMIRIQRQRETMAMARLKVLEMALQISKYVKDEEVVVFADAIFGFFCSCVGSRRLTRSKHLLFFLMQTNITQEDKKRIIEFIDNTLIDLERSWKLIVKSYATLKIYSLGSPKLVYKRPTQKTKSK